MEDLRTGLMAWETRVGSTPGIDPWCTRLSWQLSVHEAFGTRSPSSPSSIEVADDAAPPICSADEGLFVATNDWSMALRKQQFDSAAGLVPLDAVWGFSSPFVLTNGGASPFQIQQWANEMAEVLLQEPDWELTFLTGLEPGSPLDEALIRALSSGVRLVAGEPTIRCIASLQGGVDAFLERRSRTFRRNLRQATARSDAAGLTIEPVDTTHRSGIEVLSRLVAIETQSWKGAEESGIASPAMAALYRGVVDRLGGSSASRNKTDSPKPPESPESAANGIRLSVARLDGVDVGFILGGVIDGRYRGLQLSFAQSVRALSVGNLLQLHEVRRLCLEDVHTYDLGMDMDYKRSWSDSFLVTRPIIAVRR